MSQSQVGLFDPLLYNSTFVGSTVTTVSKQPSISQIFIKKFNIWSLLFNAIVPLFIVIGMLFFLKYRYNKKQQEKTTNLYYSNVAPIENINTTLPWE